MNLRSASKEPDAASCGPRASQAAPQLNVCCAHPDGASSRSRWRDTSIVPIAGAERALCLRLRSPLSARRSTAAIPAEPPKQGGAGSARAVPRFATCGASVTCARRSPATTSGKYRVSSKAGRATPSPANSGSRGYAVAPPAPAMRGRRVGTGHGMRLPVPGNAYAVMASAIASATRTARSLSRDSKRQDPTGPMASRRSPRPDERSPRKRSSEYRQHSAKPGLRVRPQASAWQRAAALLVVHQQPWRRRDCVRRRAAARPMGTPTDQPCNRDRTGIWSRRSQSRNARQGEPPRRLHGPTFASPSGTTGPTPATRHLPGVPKREPRS